MKAALFETFRGPIAVREVADPACPANGVIAVMDRYAGSGITVIDRL